MKPLCCLIFITALLQASAQSINRIKWYRQVNDQVSLVFNQLGERLKAKSEVDETFEPVQYEFSRTSRLLQDCLNALQKDQVYGQFNDEILEKYYNELENYSSLLDDPMLINHKDSLRTLIEFIKQDLELKYDNTAVLSSALVKVTVRVLNSAGNNELSGYNVFVKPEISVDPRLVEMFNPTTNAIKEISPGRKLIWIEREGKRLGERREGIRRSAGKYTVDFVVTQ